MFLFSFSFQMKQIELISLLTVIAPLEKERDILRIQLDYLVLFNQFDVRRIVVLQLENTEKKITDEYRTFFFKTFILDELR